MAVFKVSVVEVNSCLDYKILGPLLFILFFGQLSQKRNRILFLIKILNLQLSPETLKMEVGNV